MALQALKTPQGASDLTLVTDGPLHLRQCLLPEALRKNFHLADYLYRFHDLRKEFSAAFPAQSSAATVEDMLNRECKIVGNTEKLKVCTWKIAP
jgi:hypothetical protein